MASVASNSSGYGPFDSDGPDRNVPLHADPIEGETWFGRARAVRLSMIFNYGRAGHCVVRSPTQPLLSYSYCRCFLTT